MSPFRRSLGEAAGTAALLVAVVGSGIAAEQLSPTDTGLALLENAAATGVALFVIILLLLPSTGAHINPAVTVASWLGGRMRADEALAYLVAQFSGGVVGTIVANLMFDLPWMELATTARSGSHLVFAEVVATVGLLAIVFVLADRGQLDRIPMTVGVYIAGAYFFTSSTSFANPAVTVARMFSDTFSGIDPSDVAWFVAAQLAVAVAFGLGLRRRRSVRD